ncbi:MAG: hypothetical protein BRD29_00425 [Bacteroidetes bacterium QH_2_67_10]|nr:MAG: hypothetical protein BRD29_00425 [Bacteroidetes bacterium QH_2_67_10]
MRSRLALRTLASGLLAPLLLAAPVGCGFFSSDEEPLPGVYVSEEFRIQNSDGDIFDLGEKGAALEMTLAEDGEVTNGRLAVPAGVEGACAVEESFTGDYERDGQRVTFQFDGDSLAAGCFDTDTPLREVEWAFYENDATLRADADGYVLFLEKQHGVGDE